MIVNVLCVGIGGFFGAIGRYLGNLLVAKSGLCTVFPLGTLLVNLSGCFLIGFLAHWSESRAVFSQNVRLFLFVGFLGSFTTFSSFGHESLTLLRNQLPLAALANIALHIVLGLLFVWLGLGMGRLVIR